MVQMPRLDLRGVIDSNNIILAWGCQEVVELLDGEDPKVDDGT